jgi:hypothetical protein
MHFIAGTLASSLLPDIIASEHNSREDLMNAFRHIAILASLTAYLTASAHAAESPSYVDNLFVRPEIGYGYAATNDGKHGMGYHAGVSVLSTVQSVSSPVPDKRWGIQIMALSPYESKSSLSSEKYLAVGIVLEQILPAKIVATIGTLGYVGVDKARNNPFGLMTVIAWEPQITKDVQFSAGLRYESIYDTSTISRYSLNTAIKFDLY